MTGYPYTSILAPLSQTSINGSKLIQSFDHEKNRKGSIEGKRFQCTFGESKVGEVEFSREWNGIYPKYLEKGGTRKVKT